MRRRQPEPVLTTEVPQSRPRREPTISHARERGREAWYAVQRLRPEYADDFEGAREDLGELKKVVQAIAGAFLEYLTVIERGGKL
jgi:hypothetical protein